MIAIHPDYALIGKNFRILRRPYIVVEKGIVKKITDEPPKSGQILTFQDCVLVPGFVNCHTHIGDAFAKEKAYGLSLERAVVPPNGLKHRLLRSTPRDKIISGMISACKEMLANGIVCFCDFREGGLEGIKIIKDALAHIKIRAVILGRPNSDPPEKILKYANGIGLSSLNKYSTEELIEISKICMQNKKIFAFHGSETIRQREKSFNLYSKSDIMRALELPYVSFIVHATHISENEIIELKKRRIKVIICPRANAYFGVGVPNISLMMKYNIIGGIGTDNVFANSPSLFKEFDFIVRLARIQNTVIDPRELLALATWKGFETLNLVGGVIDIGFHADFFLFDLSKPNVTHVENIIKAIVLRGESNNIVATFIQGEIVYET